MQPSDRSINGRQMYMEVVPAKARALLASNPSLFVAAPAASTVRGNHEADYDAKETTTSAYGMGTLQIGRTTIVGGIRAEYNTWDSLQKTVDQPTASVVTSRPGRDYSEFLPGLHFR
ncbi:MAG: hypothetical protein ACREH8_08315, partial [Opitutaceae bacterium]